MVLLCEMLYGLWAIHGFVFIDYDESVNGLEDGIFIFVICVVLESVAWGFVLCVSFVT